MFLFRIICFLQMLVTVYLSFTSLIRFFQSGRIYFIFETIFFMLMASLAVLGLSLIASNYPDKPVAGQQKRLFNWLYLLNFLLLAFIFGLLFLEINQLEQASRIYNTDFFSLPARELIPFFITAAILIFHFFILYGLYNLRRLLFINYHESRKFEFEAGN